MGYATGLVVLVTVLAAITLLPALLGALKIRVYSRRDRRAGRFESSMSHSPTAARLRADGGTAAGRVAGRLDPGCSSPSPLRRWA